MDEINYHELINVLNMNRNKKYIVRTHHSTPRIENERYYAKYKQHIMIKI